MFLNLKICFWVVWIIFTNVSVLRLNMKTYLKKFSGFFAPWFELKETVFLIINLVPSKMEGFWYKEVSHDDYGDYHDDLILVRKLAPRAPCLLLRKLFPLSLRADPFPRVFLSLVLSPKAVSTTLCNTCKSKDFCKIPTGKREVEFMLRASADLEPALWHTAS